MLRDRLVCGVNDERIQKRLLLEVKLTLDGALKIAQAQKAAGKCSREISAKSQVTVHMVKKSVPGSTVQCFRCGRADHVADKCPFLTAQCFRCQKTGHIREVCKQQRKKSGTRKEGVEMVTVEVQEGGVEEEGEYLTCLEHLRVHALNKGKGKPIVCEVSVDGMNITMELDTRSAVSIVSEDVFSHRWPMQTKVGGLHIAVMHIFWRGIEGAWKKLNTKAK